MWLQTQFFSMKHEGKLKGAMCNFALHGQTALQKVFRKYFEYFISFEKEAETPRQFATSSLEVVTF